MAPKDAENRRSDFHVTVPHFAPEVRQQARSKATAASQQARIDESFCRLRAKTNYEPSFHEYSPARKADASCCRHSSIDHFEANSNDLWPVFVDSRRSQANPSPTSLGDVYASMHAGKQLRKLHLPQKLFVLRSVLSTSLERTLTPPRTTASEPIVCCFSYHCLG